MKIRLLAVLGLGLSLSTAACGGGDAEAITASGDPAEAVATDGAAPATGKVIEVKMVTDDAGNYFEPAEVEVRQGDVLRFTLASGVHNASFTVGASAGGAALPEATTYLQLPGQTVDVPVTMGPGEYTFQCDPHAALGMVGKLTVK